MKKTALITGASNGIGLEFAKIHASKGDDLILVARNNQKLDEIKTELEQLYACKVLIIAKDLSQKDAAQEVYSLVKSHNLVVHYLINNAGFGDFGNFSEANWEKTDQMIQLNITALTQFTQLFLKDMLARNEGKILNVASTAAFQPGPLMAVYYATKAYVLHFSEAVANEIGNSRVTITALCPGATTSGFQVLAAMEHSKLFKNKKLPSAAEVAAYGYKAMQNGKTVAIHGLKNALLATSVRFTPRSLVTKITRFIQESA